MGATMAVSAVYRSPLRYQLLMRLLYGRHYAARDAAIAEHISDHARVIDLCCGPGTLFVDHLRQRTGVEYVGVDINSVFLDRLRRLGAQTIERDMLDGAPLPIGDHLVMQASLYHFLPGRAEAIVAAMLAAARKTVIISEPIRNLSDSPLKPLARFARASTDPGTGAHAHRFNEEQLDALFQAFAARVQHSFLIPGGREKVYILAGERNET
jgi:SAM-dependent methyltransferase